MHAFFFTQYWDHLPHNSKKKKRYILTKFICNYCGIVECLEGAVPVFWFLSPLRQLDWLIDEVSDDHKRSHNPWHFSRRDVSVQMCVFFWAWCLAACRQGDVTGSERHGGASAAGYIKQVDDYITVRRLMANPFFLCYGFAAAGPPFPFQFNPVRLVIHSWWGVLPLLRPRL